MSWDDAIDGVDRDTPGGRMPRAWTVAARLRAANDDIAHAMVADGLPAYAELHCLSGFLVPARRLQCRTIVHARATLRLWRPGDHRRVLACRHRARPGSFARHRRALDRRQRIHPGRWHPLRAAGGKRAWLSAVVRADHHRAACGKQGRVSARACRGGGAVSRCGTQRVRAVVTRCAAAGEQGAWLQQVFGERAFLAVELHREQDDAARLLALQLLAQQLGMTALASGDAHMAQRRERIVQDTLTAIRHGLPLAECGAHLFRNGERHLRTRRALGNIYPDALLQAAVDLAQRCSFDMSRLEYTYPRELVPEGHTPASYLRQLTEEGMRERWPNGTPAKVRADIEKELALIAHKNYEAFFLTVQDVVRFAREQHILPGPWLIGQFGGVLCTGHHRGQPG